MTKRTRTVFLVRHGESDWNRKGVVQGQRDDALLTATGRRSARELAERFSVGDVALVVSSDLRRARETAVPIGGRLGIIPVFDERLRERSLGELEGRPSEVLTPDVTGVKDGVVVDSEVAPRGGESLRQMYERISSFVEDLRDHLGRGSLPGGSVILVGHGGSLRLVAAVLDEMPLEQMTWMSLENASVLERTLPTRPSTVVSP